MIKTLTIDWDVDEAGENSEYIISIIGDVLGEYTLEENIKNDNFDIYQDEELGILLSNIDIEGNFMFHGDRNFIDDFRKELNGQLSSVDTPIHIEEEECFDELIISLIIKIKQIS